MADWQSSIKIEYTLNNIEKKSNPEMKSIFDPTIRDEIISRIYLINENSKAQWGKMNVGQMLTHCILWQEMIFERIHCNRVFIGKIFGKIALKNVLKDDKPLGRNSPSSRELIIETDQDDLDIVVQKKKLIDLVKEYAGYNNPDFTHPFFGPMTQEQVGYFVYKHTDHHLRQFGC
jgi:Protein of unknown function (DUF1569)